MKFGLNRDFLWWVLLFSLVLLPIIPFLGFGVSDDLSFIGNIAPDYWSDLKYSLSRAGHISRPIYGFIQTTTLHLFKDQYIYYNILRLVLWLMIIYQSIRVFGCFFGERAKWVFVFFVSFPIFSSAHLFNFFQMGYLLSLLFYLYALEQIKDKNGEFTGEKYWSYVLLTLLALFSCEIIFPLMAFPIIHNHLGKWKALLHSKLFRWSIIVFIIYFIFKFLIGPLYQMEAYVYGFAPSKNSILQALYYFVVILAEIPLLLLEVIPFYFNEPALWLSVLVVPFIYQISSRDEYIINKKLVYSIAITIALCSLIFFISNYPAVSFGFYNKMMLPAHVCYSVLISMLCLRLLKTRFYVISYLLAILWFASMEMQTINSIRSWDLREQKLKEYAKVLNAENHHSDNVFIEAPYFLSSNYNNEHVFSLNDDFQGGLSYFGYKGDAHKIYPFCVEMLRNKLYWSNHNIQNVLTRNKINDFKIVQKGKISEKNHNLNSLNELSFDENQECLRSRLRNCFIQKMKTL